jgi:hypothetical protein
MIIRKFDREIRFDERSKQFPIRTMVDTAKKRKSKKWSCYLWLDQGKEGACTGFSVSSEAAAEPVPVEGITNETAFMLYKRAKQLDEFKGENYEGSSVLGAIKAGVEKGWYSEYRWAFSEYDLSLAIGYCGPAVLGVNWYEGMVEPDYRGIIAPTGRCVGGHAILCNGYDAKTKRYCLHNSWGSSWGINGECYIGYKAMKKLLMEKGEACIPIIRLNPGLNS